MSEWRKNVKEFADELRKWWSFNDAQQHTHSWHTREDFIEQKLPELIAEQRKQSAIEALQFVYDDIKSVAEFEAADGGDILGYGIGEALKIIKKYKDSL